MQTVLQAFRALIVLTALTGILYPLIVTGVGRLAFTETSGGSLIKQGDRIVGSKLLAQRTEDPRYFSPRPSAGDFATVASSASNLGPTSAQLAQAVAERRTALGDTAPADLLTTSGSGLDPHVSPAAAQFQAARVAQARNLPVGQVLTLIESMTEPPQYSIFGEERVNVLALNLALDAAR
ncbi:potassium-transporting ATPase subunit KdpC [Verrucomicrobiota bacterium sgz303538]